jgi:hypothetical protein
VLTVITEYAGHSLVTQGWAGEKPFPVTVDTGAYETIVRSDIVAGWPQKTAEQTFHAEDDICTSPIYPERSFPNYEPGAAPTEHLGFRRQCHQ